MQRGGVILGFLKTPFIPEGKVSLAVVDYRLNPAAAKSLKSKGVELIRTVKCRELYEAVDGHPDMLLHHVGGDKIVLAPNIYKAFAPAFEEKGFAVTKGATWLVRNYPGNIAYNVLRIGDIVFHNTKYTDKELMKAFEEKSLTIVHVNQGYTKCSVCILDKKTIITSDQKIAKALEKHGIESFLIKPGGIELKGLNYGFVGGASGLISKNKIAFTGDSGCLNEGRKLLDFINSKGFEVNVLCEEKLTDYGSIIPLKCQLN